jgi:hypothetical protein
MTTDTTTRDLDGIAYFVNTRGRLDRSSVEGWIAVDTITLTTPARNV